MTELQRRGGLDDEAYKKVKSTSVKLKMYFEYFDMKHAEIDTSESFTRSQLVPHVSSRPLQLRG